MQASLRAISQVQIHLPLSQCPHGRTPTPTLLITPIPLRYISTIRPRQYRHFEYFDITLPSKPHPSNMAPVLPYTMHPTTAPTISYNITPNASHNGTLPSDQQWGPNGSDWINVAIGVAGISVAVLAVVLDHRVRGIFDGVASSMTGTGARISRAMGGFFKRRGARLDEEES
ncbi:hypothetical protein PMIN04_001499 [Paraphaeosphaeria minitans]